MRTRRTRWAAVALTALVMGIAVGLLAMHVLSGFTASGGSQATSGSAATSMPSHAEHGGSVHAGFMSSRSEARATDPMATDHLHDALSCIPFLVGGITLVIAAAWAIRGRRASGAPQALVQRVTELVQRPPPTSVRLSLVGTSRC